MTATDAHFEAFKARVAREMQRMVWRRIFREGDSADQIAARIGWKPARFWRVLAGDTLGKRGDLDDVSDLSFACERRMSVDIKPRETPHDRPPP